jgi:hypothetical protein
MPQCDLPTVPYDYAPAKAIRSRHLPVEIREK